MNRVVLTGRISEKPKILSVEPLQISFNIYTEKLENDKTIKVRVSCYSTKSCAERIMKTPLGRDGLVLVEGFIFQKLVTRNTFRYLQLTLYVADLRKWKEFV